jgi:hypothetical protein
MNTSTSSLRELFLKGWSAETCFPSLKDKWTPENPALGQCAVTALVVNDLFGGHIVSNSEYHHYWNILEEVKETEVDGEKHYHHYDYVNKDNVIDLTKEQWGDVVIEGHEPSSREYILFSERGRQFKTLERYQLLRKAIEREMLHIDYTPETLEECYAYLDKFLQDKEVFKNVDDEAVSGIGHHTLGRWLRNQWHLWWSEKFAEESIEEKDSLYPQTKPALKTFFENLGITHPDDMTGIVIRSYHRYLNGRPVELEKQVEQTITFYKENKL